MFQNEWPNPGIPWQTANKHLLLGQFCQVQTLRPKTLQRLCRDSQLRHHTPLQLHLGLNDMSVWPRRSKKEGENQPETRDSAKVVDVYSQCRIPHYWFQRLQFLTHLPTLTWRRGVLTMRKESSCSSDNGASNCTHSTAVKPRSKPQTGDAAARLSLSGDPRSPR